MDTTTDTQTGPTPFVTAEGVTAPPEGATPPASPAETQIDPKQAIIATLKDARNKLGAGADPIKISVPGYGGQLVIEYQWVDLDELTATSDSLAQIKSSSDLNVAASADTVVACCKEVYVRVDGKLQPLSTDGTPIKFDDRLAYALGFEARTARDTAIRAFNNPYALIQTGNSLVAWLKDTTVKIDGEFLGE